MSFTRGREAERGRMVRSRHSKDSWHSSDLCAWGALESGLGE